MVWMSSRQQRDLVIHEQETTVATSFPGRSRSINDPHPIRPSIVHHSPPLRLLLSSGSSAFSLPFHLPARQPVFIYNVAQKKNESIYHQRDEKKRRRHTSSAHPPADDCCPEMATLAQCVNSSVPAAPADNIFAGF